MTLGQKVILVVSLVLLAGAGGLGVVAIRRRGPEPQPDAAVALVPGDQVEAELQELIAEEHAREAARDRPLTPA